MVAPDAAGGPPTAEATPARSPGGAADPPPAGAPVTVVVSRVVRPGAEQEFERWLSGVCAEASRFEGHLGVNVIRPTDPRNPEYVLIFRFDRYEHLRRWEESPVRAEWLARALPLTLRPPRAQLLTGLEYWFTPPGAPPPPSRHRMAFVTWLAIYPLVTLVAAGLQPLLGPLPLAGRTLVMSALLVVLMTYVVMPHMTRLFARWLFRPSAPPASGRAAGS